MAYSKKITPENALTRLAALCSRGEQAECDLRTKLSNWAISSTEANEIISRLYELNFINKDRYVAAFVRDKFRFEGWGKIKISHHLRQKGFDGEKIGIALAEISDDDYAETLTRLLTSKLRSLKGKDYMQTKAALVRFAASRGFEPNIIYPTVNSILKPDGEFFDDEY